MALEDSFYKYLSLRLLPISSKLSLEDQAELDGAVADAARELSSITNQSVNEALLEAVERHGRN